MKHLKRYQEFIVEELRRVVSYSSGTGHTQAADLIYDDPTSSKSPSSGVLLKRDLKNKEEFTDEPIEVRNNIRLKVRMNNLKFLKDKAKDGELRCEYCDKGPLKVYDVEPGQFSDDPKAKRNWKFNKDDGATCDHKISQSKGGDKFDYSNLAVCCYDCNKKKGNMSYEDWTNRKK